MKLTLSLLQIRLPEAWTIFLLTKNTMLLFCLTKYSTLLAKSHDDFYDDFYDDSDEDF